MLKRLRDGVEKAVGDVSKTSHDFTWVRPKCVVADLMLVALMIVTGEHGVVSAAFGEAASDFGIVL